MEDISKDRILDTLKVVTTDLQIEDGKHRAIKMSIDLISVFFPKVGEASKLIADNRESLEGVVNLGGKLFQLVGENDDSVLEGKSDGAISDTLSLLEKDTGGKSLIDPEVAKGLAVSNPYVFLVVAALTIIEKDVKSILRVTEEILSFLELEKETEIEADVKTLSSIIEKYSVNCDNKSFINNNHKMVLDIQRTARKNMLFYEKSITELTISRQLPSFQNNVEKFFAKASKQFEYYKMALYSFALASFLEIILSENFKEDNISLIKHEIQEANDKYFDLYEKCLETIKIMCHRSFESNTIKGIGMISGAIGKLFSTSKKEKAANFGEKLKEKSDSMFNKSSEMEDGFIKRFEDRKDPGTLLFVDKLESLIFIFNRTGKICIDDESIYLVEK